MAVAIIVFIIVIVMMTPAAVFPFTFLMKTPGVMFRSAKDAFAQFVLAFVVCD